MIDDSNIIYFNECLECGNKELKFEYLNVDWKKEKYEMVFKCTVCGHVYIHKIGDISND